MPRVAKTTFYAPGRRLVEQGDIVADVDPIMDGREHLFQPIEQATRRPGEASTARRTTTTADPPPKSGAGSSESAWRSYAATFGFELPDDAGRDDIIAFLEQAGKPVEQD